VYAGCIAREFREMSNVRTSEKAPSTTLGE
jgi:hypothetical protein